MHEHCFVVDRRSDHIVTGRCECGATKTVGVTKWKEEHRETDMPLARPTPNAGDGEETVANS